MMYGFRIHAQPNGARAANALQFVDEFLGDNAFAVIANDNRIRVKQTRLEGCEQTARAGGIGIAAGFAVHAHNLLLVGDDARFDAGRPLSHWEQATAVDPLLAEKLLQGFAMIVAADEAKQLRLRGERRKVARDICGAARHETLAYEFNN